MWNMRVIRCAVAVHLLDSSRRSSQPLKVWARHLPISLRKRRETREMLHSSSGTPTTTFQDLIPTVSSIRVAVPFRRNLLRDRRAAEVASLRENTLATARERKAVAAAFPAEGSVHYSISPYSFTQH